jgi:hypothetical protein
MDNVLIIVVNNGMAPGGALAGSSISPTRQRGNSPFIALPKRSVEVWRGIRQGSTHAANWHAIGVATAFATSLAAWAGVALVISRFVK